MTHHFTREGLPAKLKGKVLETKQGSSFINLTGKNRVDFLGHLPQAASYVLVEIDLRGIVSEASLKPFEKQLKVRENQRKTRSDKEEKYFGKVDSHLNEKFDELKKKVVGYYNPVE